MNLENQTMVVFGGSSGIGLEVVRRASATGARVLAVARDGEKLATALKGLGPLVSGVALDATDRPALDAFFTEVGAVDHLVLTLSGGEGAGPFDKLDLQALRRGFEAKFWPQLQAVQAGLAALRPGGSVTFVTAVSARIARPGVSGLGAINGAIEAMVGTLARELAPTRVNAVSPGVIDTAWWSRLPAEAKAGGVRRTGAHAAGRPRWPRGRCGARGDVLRRERLCHRHGDRVRRRVAFAVTP